MYHTNIGPILDMHSSSRESFASQTQRIPQYYSSYHRSTIPWQSTRPLPDPEADSVVNNINDHNNTINYTVRWRIYDDRGDGKAKNDILDPAFREITGDIRCTV